MRERGVPFYQVDAFTTRRFAGNPAGVVPDARGLSARTMQRMARELGNPETAFLLPPTADGHDVRIRFFTPTTEVPLCGHATLASHYVRATLSRHPGGMVTQKSRAGLRRIRITRLAHGDYAIGMLQGRPRFGDALSGSAIDRLAAAVGCRLPQLGDAPIQIVTTGHSKVIVPLRRLSDLDRLRPDAERLTLLSRAIGCNGFHFFAFERSGRYLTRCRMFAPAIGIPEDPVTGNGNGPLGAYLVRHGLLAHDGNEAAFWSSQGSNVGRPGAVRVTVTIRRGEPVHVEVGGRAVIVFRGEFCPR